MNENGIEPSEIECKKRKKKRKHKKRNADKEEQNISDKTNEINHEFEGDSTMLIKNNENKVDDISSINKNVSKEYGNSYNYRNQEDSKVDISVETKQCNERFRDHLSPNSIQPNICYMNDNELPRSSSMPQDVLIHDLSAGLRSSAPNLIDDNKSQSTESVITMNSVNRIYQPPTLKSHHNTLSMQIHKNNFCNAEKSQLETELKNELMKYFPERKSKIMVITWNMAGTSTYPEHFMGIIENSNSDEMCDIYLLCFQESTSNKQELLSRIQMTFGGHYVIYNYMENGSLFGVLVGHKKFIWNIALIGKSSLSTRVTPITKGVVAISFQFFGNTFLFLGSHFTKSSKDFTGDKGRNSLRVEDYNTILYSKELIKILTTSDMKLGPDEKNLSHYFDYTFWAGDFNFRILRDDVTIARLILSEIDQNDGAAFEKLLEYDELINNQTAGLIFQEFEEGRIMFLPTYNFIIQTDEYNEKRTPSYTDRILFRSHKSRGIECVHYNSVRSYTYSDHKPVCATMEVIIEPQCHEHLKSSGIFNKEIYTKCFNDFELKQKELMTTSQSRMCSIQ